MDLLPQAYLIGLIVLLAAAAVVVGRQMWRVRRDELALSRLELSTAGERKEAAELYELGSVQLRKRLYGQAAESLRQALRQAEASGEPPEVRALILNALGFSQAAQSRYKEAIRHYRAALAAKADYPVALNNLAYALEKQQQPDQARTTYEQVLTLDATNKTALKRLKLLGRPNALNQNAA
jgi:tetratricopeptide (TPR) repeat protein